jgi:hypothetical protein
MTDKVFHDLISRFLSNFISHFFTLTQLHPLLPWPVQRSFHQFLPLVMPSAYKAPLKYTLTSPGLFPNSLYPTILSSCAPTHEHILHILPYFIFFSSDIIISILHATY